MNYQKINNDALRIAQQMLGYLNTPNLDLASELSEIDVFYLNSNKNIDTSNLKIERHLRLGNRVEYFFEFVLKSIGNFEIVAKSIQVIHNKITQGELDFIVYDKQKNEYIHLEIANKFYLYDKNISQEEKRWIGPNRTDSLWQKCEKLREKQFPLLIHQNTLEYLNPLNLNPEKISQKLNFKAQLFVPFADLGKEIPLVNQQNIKGYFLNLEQFKTFHKKDYEYFVPEKQDWFSEPEICEVWFGYKEIISSISFHFRENKSPLLWLKKSDNTFEKLFVVWW